MTIIHKKYLFGMLASKSVYIIVKTFLLKIGGKGTDMIWNGKEDDLDSIAGHLVDEGF